MTLCCVIGGVLGEKIGRKKMMLLVSPLLAIGYIVQALAEESYQLNIGRFICGIAGGLACGPGAVNIVFPESHLKYYVLYQNQCLKEMHIFA